MSTHPYAGKPAPKDLLIDVSRLEAAFYDGTAVTPSHNPPGDDCFKYNPPNAGPADTDVTDWIQNRASELLLDGNRGVQRIGFAAAFQESTTHAEDYVTPYVAGLASVIDLEAIRSAGAGERVLVLCGSQNRHSTPI